MQGLNPRFSPERVLVVPTPHLPACQIVFLGTCQCLHSRLLCGGLQCMHRKVTEGAAEIDAVCMFTTPQAFPGHAMETWQQEPGVGWEMGGLSSPPSQTEVYWPGLVSVRH